MKHLSMTQPPLHWPESFSVLMTTVEPGGGMIQRVFVDGLLSRKDTLAATGEVSYSAIYDGQRMIALSVHREERWYQREPLTRAKDGTPGTLSPAIPSGGSWETIGSETLHQRSCTRYRHTGAGMGGLKIVNDFWADDATHAPARIAFGSSYWDFTEFLPGKPDPKLFSTLPPEGYRRV